MICTQLQFFVDRTTNYPTWDNERSDLILGITPVLDSITKSLDESNGGTFDRAVGTLLAVGDWLWDNHHAVAFLLHRSSKSELGNVITSSFSLVDGERGGSGGSHVGPRPAVDERQALALALQDLSVINDDGRRFLSAAMQANDRWHHDDLFVVMLGDRARAHLAMCHAVPSHSVDALALLILVPTALELDERWLTRALSPGSSETSSEQLADSDRSHERRARKASRKSPVNDDARASSDSRRRQISQSHPTPATLPMTIMLTTPTLTTPAEPDCIMTTSDGAGTERRRSLSRLTHSSDMPTIADTPVRAPESNRRVISRTGSSLALGYTAAVASVTRGNPPSPTLSERSLLLGGRSSPPPNADRSPPAGERSISIERAASAVLSPRSASASSSPRRLNSPSVIARLRQLIARPRTGELDTDDGSESGAPLSVRRVHSFTDALPRIVDIVTADATSTATTATTTATSLASSAPSVGKRPAIPDIIRLVVARTCVR
jgi:hypothetical protein